MWHGRYSQWQRPLVTQRTQLNFYFYFCETLFSSALTNLTKIYVKVICTVGLYVYFIQRSKLLKHIYSLPHRYPQGHNSSTSRCFQSDSPSMPLPGTLVQTIASVTWAKVPALPGLPASSLTTSRASWLLPCRAGTTCMVKGVAAARRGGYGPTCWTHRVWTQVSAPSLTYWANYFMRLSFFFY